VLQQEEKRRESARKATKHLHEVHPDLYPSLRPTCNFKKSSYDHEVWDAKLSATGAMVDLVVRGKGRASRQFTYTVPVSRANKALRTLHPAHVKATLAHSCGCIHACNIKFSESSIIKKRLWYLQHGR
jgi:hypothetical protein